jgi:hypothetical protein
MWLLLIIVLSSESPYNHRGSVQNFYISENECRTELSKAVQALYLKGTQVTGSCEFREYLTPKRTF